jgi:hypothetical protein
MAKERETFLKAIHKPMPIVNDETGEVFTVNPPIKTSTTSLVLTPVKEQA